jgi:hypothetical protein
MPADETARVVQVRRAAHCLYLLDAAQEVLGDVDAASIRATTFRRFIQYLLAELGVEYVPEHLAKRPPRKETTYAN